MILKTATKTKLEHISKMLATEFQAVPDGVIASDVDMTAARLLETASFDDYVPILTHRYVRARLRSAASAQELAKAA
jgi:hypothetical protein